jgi:hypothetical protein
MRSKTYFYLIVGGLAVGCCIGFILMDSQATAESRIFVSKPQFLIWLFLFSSQFAFWAIIASPLFTELKQLKNHFQANKLEISITFIASLVLTIAYLYFFAFVHLPKELPLAHHRLKVWTLTIPGFLMAFLALSGIWLVYIASRNLGSNSRPDENAITEYLQLRKQLDFFVMIAGILIGMGTLTIGALRHALRSLEKSELVIQPEVILLYGAYFSLLMALVFVPTRVAFQSTGEHLRDSLFPIPKIDSDA